jgi:hypothetical protein
MCSEKHKQKNSPCSPEQLWKQVPPVLLSPHHQPQSENETAERQKREQMYCWTLQNTVSQQRNRWLQIQQHTCMMNNPSGGKALVNIGAHAYVC